MNFSHVRDHMSLMKDMRHCNGLPRGSHSAHNSTSTEHFINFELNLMIIDKTLICSDSHRSDTEAHIHASRSVCNVSEEFEEALALSVESRSSIFNCSSQLFSFYLTNTDTYAHTRRGDWEYLWQQIKWSKHAFAVGFERAWSAPSVRRIHCAECTEVSVVCTWH